VYYNKLVRDGIPEKIRGNNEECDIRSVVDEQEFQQELLKKIAEEASSLSRVRTRTDFLDEYADLMVVLNTLAKTMELSEAEIKVALEENIKKKGGFDRRIYLHWSSDTNYKSNETPQGIV
jgi:predicted house-cleaning noncanonical NTP pyrophosphatase (MazG superfamily)